MTKKNITVPIPAQNNQAGQDLNIKEVVKLIRAVKKLGVISMKLGTLEFVLNAETLAPRYALKVSKEEIDDVDLKNQYQLDFDSAKEELQTMHVEDPLGFERALSENDLEDGSLDGSEGKIEEAYD